MYEQMQRVQASTDPESEQATEPLSIIGDLFSPYNILVRYNEVTWDNDSETNSNEYEWGRCSDITEDIEVDTIQSYTSLSQKGQGSESRPLEFGP